MLVDPAASADRVTVSACQAGGFAAPATIDVTPVVASFDALIPGPSVAHTNVVPFQNATAGAVLGQ